MDSLSKRKLGSVSAARLTGLLQVRPPSVDLLISMAAGNGGTLVPAKLMLYKSPLGAKVTQGSEARWKVPPETCEMPGMTTGCQVVPPSKLTPATRPRA